MWEKGTESELKCFRGPTFSGVKKIQKHWDHVTVLLLKASSLHQRLLLQKGNLILTRNAQEELRVTNLSKFPEKSIRLDSMTTKAKTRRKFI